jgi:DNA-binding PadR family transcriptional regulator
MLLQAISESEEIAHCDLARDYAASVETLSRRLASARKSGLVQMQTGKRQKRIYRLTPKGTRLLVAALPYWEMAQFRLRKTLGDTDWQLLSGFAEHVAAAAIRAELLSAAKNRGGPEVKMSA